MSVGSKKTKITFVEHAEKEDIPYEGRMKGVKQKFGIDDKIRLLENFVKNYEYRNDNEFYTRSSEFVATMDGATKFLGYKPEVGTRFRYKNVEIDHLLGVVSKEKFVAFPTLDFYPYKKGSDVLAQLILYDKVLLQYYEIPTDVLILANEENKDVDGRIFNIGTLKQTQQVFLKDTLGSMKMKRVDEKEFFRKLADKM